MSRLSSATVGILVVGILIGIVAMLFAGVGWIIPPPEERLMSNDAA